MEIVNKITALENALYVISTPIGNMMDITLRALEVISNVDYLFCEDTRVTNKLLEYFNFDKKSLFVYNDFSKDYEREKIIKLLRDGKKIGLVSDAGTPLVSDPGFKLVRECKDNNIKVIPICGASAVLSALVASGLPSDKFLFYGFLPEKENERLKELNKLRYRQETIIFYESPKRVMFALNDIYNIIGDVEVCLAKELTKQYEEIKTDNIKNIIDYLNNNQDKIRGEFVLILKNQLLKASYDMDIEKIKIIYDNLHSVMKTKDIVDFIIKIGYNYNRKELYDLLITI